VAIAGYTDLFAAGLGFDITGAYLHTESRSITATATANTPASDTRFKPPIDEPPRLDPSASPSAIA
jgi:hypothetical protein